jgi:type III secretory pathway component EscR
MTKILGSLLLGLALMAPVAIQAQDHDGHDQNSQSKRYYDKTHKDYHQWNSQEDSSYHQWLKDNHRKDHDFAKAPKSEQQSYWNYRHDHSEAH